MHVGLVKFGKLHDKQTIRQQFHSRATAANVTEKLPASLSETCYEEVRNLSGTTLTLTRYEEVCNKLATSHGLMMRLLLWNLALIKTDLCSGRKVTHSAVSGETDLRNFNKVLLQNAVPSISSQFQAFPP